MKPCGDGSGDVRDVCKHLRADGFGNLTDALKVDNARVGAGSADDHLRAMFFGEALQFVVINLFPLLREAVVRDLVADA